jgi:membrane protease YdiL (CAAX protease family)
VRRRPREGRHSEPPGHATLALLPRTTGERRLFTVVGVTAGVCEEWLYRGFFLAVVAALAGGLPTGVLVVVAAVAFGLAHAYQGLVGIVTTGLLGGIMAAVYLQTGSLLLPVLLHAVIDLRFLLVPSRVLPLAGQVPG